MFKDFYSKKLIPFASESDIKISEEYSKNDFIKFFNEYFKEDLMSTH